MHLAAEFLAAQPRLMGRAAADPVQSLAQQGKDAEHGKAFQGQQDLAAGLLFDPGQDGEVVAQQSLVDHKGGRCHLRRIEAAGEAAVAAGARSQLDHLPGQAVLVQGLHEGIGIELLHIPHAGPFPQPLSIIMAPIIAGTPVV